MSLASVSFTRIFKFIFYTLQNVKPHISLNSSDDSKSYSQKYESTIKLIRIINKL